MHFSSPSGHRLSWWWPWNRGAVGRLSSGYITVSTFLNISVKVTPNPLTGLRKSSTGDLLSGGGASGRDGARRSGIAVQVEPVIVRPVHRRGWGGIQPPETRRRLPRPRGRGQGGRAPPRPGVSPPRPARGHDEDHGA